MLGVDGQRDDGGAAARPLGERGGALRRDVARAPREEHEADEVGPRLKRGVARFPRRKARRS